MRSVRGAVNQVRALARTQILVYIYIYIYTRIFARAPRALDSPIRKDLGPKPLGIAHTILNEAHLQKHSDIDVSIFTCQDENAETRSAQIAWTAIERSTL